jgi:DNA-binding MarR family transcriptional regulator
MLRMSELARLLRHSQSRTTHAVSRLEADGRVRRRPCPTDGRGQLAEITPAGRRLLREAAPGHVAEVREKVFDRLSAAQVTQLRRICQTLLDGLGG